MSLPPLKTNKMKKKIGYKQKEKSNAQREGQFHIIMLEKWQGKKQTNK